MRTLKIVAIIALVWVIILIAISAYTTIQLNNNIPKAPIPPIPTNVVCKATINGSPVPCET